MFLLIKIAPFRRSAPASGGGGGGGIVTPTYTSTYNETTEDYDISCDMEFSAIEAAVQAGACVGAYFVRADESGDVEFYPLSSISGQVLIFMTSRPMDNPEMEFTGLSIFRMIVHQSTGDIIQKDLIPQS